MSGKGRFPKAGARRPDRPFPAPAGGRQAFRDVRAMKGIGPNKACGRKGGIRGQGSKRG